MSSKTIEELEGYVWTKSANLSGKMEECDLLRKQPIKKLNLESILHLLQNNVGTAYLLPKALDLLEKKPLRMVDYYEGDLLEALITLPHNELQKHGELIPTLLKILNKIDKTPKVIKKNVKAFKKTYA